MRIAIRDLTTTKHLNVIGDESWLKRIYDLFPTPTNLEKPLLKAEVHISPSAHGTADVSVKLTYEPYVDCSVCAQPIRWQLALSEQIQFRSPPENELPREHNLAKEELDHYFFDDDEIDIEALLNELIQLTLPSRLVRVLPQSNQCTICQRDLSETQAYQDPGDYKKDNPFRVLKKLKQPH